MSIKIEFVPGATPETHMPRYATQGAAGMDLCARLFNSVFIYPEQRLMIPVGFKLQLSPGMEAQIRPRSGLALKHGITVLNAPGTIDSDYRGEVGVILVNHGKEAFLIEHGARIAQMVFAQVQTIQLMVGDIDDTDRGAEGFGHTGV
jgi:dUTP pyrophosphatase